MSKQGLLRIAVLLGLLILSPAGRIPKAAAAGDAAVSIISGSVRDSVGAPVAGAMITISYGSPFHSQTAFSDDDGHYRLAAASAANEYSVRIRRTGWKDLQLVEQHPSPGRPFDLRIERETNPALLAAQLPANRWYGLLLERVEDPGEREELVRQCTYCHQQGSWATRRLRDDAEWQKILALMARMGGTLSNDLREKLPALFSSAYEPEKAVAALTAHMNDPGFAPPPDAEVRRAVVDQWELGGMASMQHDIAVHPDGRIYSVDMLQDKLYRLDPKAIDGARMAWDVPRGDLPLGGAFGGMGTPTPPNSNAHVGPHSLQVAPDESIWITLALGNQLARFDPKDESWSIEELEHGFYPHTLRFDPRGRIWYTIAASNHLGMFDPATGEHREMRLPAASFQQSLILRLFPAFVWLNKYVDLMGASTASEGMTLPVPYGIDIDPDGVVWFSQLNQHRIGRVDPDSYEIEMIDTPFTGPRRLRFDSKGKLWIPAFSSSLIARFDPATRIFDSFELPIEPRGTETPYALNVDRSSDTVWICGANSDSIWRFDPDSEHFTNFPLPTRGTFTREIDFDEQGRIWTSNSNIPAWHIEGGLQAVIRLDPDGADDLAPQLAETTAPQQRPAATPLH
jgi:virginiamycin B lyase